MGDSIAAAEIEARLSAHSVNQHSVSMEIYLQERGQYLLFEALINSAYFHRAGLLREIANHAPQCTLLKTTD
ncbi:hypothetical protein ACFPFP_41735 [Bradyrhizobium sp. GCM10023182]|uniref:KTSC domain-containing protein n=1 Tax=Bradyrhizobium zhengyangense TaxID=2911009 RepID=A0ABS9M2I1_9BRAD|nr:hypothetical protein [Bradyrhizobium zhengyangense]MCG2673361.1 hypothetical protein [Bradyrhizobium zhengyangense]